MATQAEIIESKRLLKHNLDDLEIQIADMKKQLKIAEDLYYRHSTMLKTLDFIEHNPESANEE